MAGARPSRETAIAIGVSLLAIAAMAVDHLVGTEREPGEEDSFPVDPAAFALGSAVSVALVALLFRFVVRPAVRRGPEVAARRALTCSALAVVALPLVFLGLPFPLAGAGIALGLRGRGGSRRRLATAATAVGALVIALAAVAYTVALVA